MNENIKNAIKILEWIELNYRDVVGSICPCKACDAYQAGGIESYVSVLNAARDWNVSMADIERAKKLLTLQ